MGDSSENSKELEQAIKEHFEFSDIAFSSFYPKENEKEKFNFVFAIHDYDQLMKSCDEEYIQSQNFKTKNNDRIQWYLTVDPCDNGVGPDEDEINSCLSVCLHLVSDIPDLKIEADCRITLLKNNVILKNSVDTSFSI